MKRIAALTIVLALAAAGPAPAAVLEAETKAYPVTPGHRVHLEFPVGELRVEANDDTKVRLTLQVRCPGSESNCEERAARLKLDSDDTDGTLHLSVRGYPKMFPGGMKLKGVLQVPRALATRIEMGVGALEVYDLEGDLTVDLGVGDAEIRVPRSAFASARASAGVGDADIRVTGQRGSRSHGFVGREASWDGGPGRSRVRLEVGVGEASVRLE